MPTWMYQTISTFQMACMNTKLMDCVERREFERKTIDGNEGFVLQIPFLECAFGTTYYVVDKQNGHMMDIFNDKLEGIDCDAQMKPFNLAQLSSNDCYTGTEKTRF